MLLDKANNAINNNSYVNKLNDSPIPFFIVVKEDIIKKYIIPTAFSLTT